MSQSTLFKWLQNNLLHPYPDEDTKRKLCEECDLSMEQLNTWFINARQRYVKSRKVRAPLTKMVLHMWAKSFEFDEIFQKHMEVMLTQSSLFLAHLTTWQQLLFWITRVQEDRTDLDDFQHICEILIPTIDSVIALDLLYQAVLVQKFDYACALLRSGVLPVPLVCENGQCLRMQDIFYALSKGSNTSHPSADEFIQLCEIVEFCRSTNMNL